LAEQDKLKKYKEKRDFRKTGEPAGGRKKSSEKPIFIIQKHDASHLHYNFRLEIDGVLKSWAVPKGPSIEESYNEGKIEIYLNGQKLKGGHALIRTGKGKNERWLLIKMKDEEADARRNPVSTEPESVLSGKTIEEIRKENQ